MRKCSICKEATNRLICDTCCPIYDKRASEEVKKLGFKDTKEMISLVDYDDFYYFLKGVLTSYD